MKSVNINNNKTFKTRSSVCGVNKFIGVMVSIYKLLLSVIFMIFILSSAFSCEKRINYFKNLPDNLIFEILKYFHVCSNSIPILRLLSREQKRLIDEHFELNCFRIEELKQFGVIGSWQIINLLPKNIGEKISNNLIKSYAYRPRLLKDHLKFLRYLSQNGSLKVLFEELQNDVKGFIDPMKSYYSQRIHGFDEFLEIIGIEKITESAVEDNFCFGIGIGIEIMGSKLEWEIELVWVLVNLANILQG